jgi:hypothetical protein
VTYDVPPAGLEPAANGPASQAGRPYPGVLPQFSGSTPTVEGAPGPDSDRPTRNGSATEPATPAPSAAEPFDKRGADRLAREAAALIRRGVVGSRSPLADALLDYAPGLCDSTALAVAPAGAARTGEDATGRTADEKAAGVRLDDGLPTYPCERCGKPRTKAEGGTVFTVCDACWDATPPAPGHPDAARAKPADGGAR